MRARMRRRAGPMSAAQPAKRRADAGLGAGRLTKVEQGRMTLYAPFDGIVANRRRARQY